MGDVSGVRALAPAFEQSTGHKVIVSFESGTGIMEKINSGGPPDIVTGSPDAIDALIKQGKVMAGTRTNYAQAGVGVAVRLGAPRPDIGTPEAFKRAMLNAKSIAYSRGRSGQFANYLASLPPEERRLIEARERQFLSKREAPFSRQLRAVRDFNAVMVGVREEVDTQ